MRHVVSLLVLWSVLWPSVGAANDAAAGLRGLVEQSQAQVKVDPERSRKLAEQALQQLAGLPDADLQVRAHLLLCDYHSERDGAAAQRHVAEARALLPQLKRRGLAAGVLGCEGTLQEAAGENTRAIELYEQQVALAEKTQDDEMQADALFNRGHLRGVRGEFASGLADLKRSRALFERLQMPFHALTVENTIAILYNRMGDHVQARHYYESALKAQAAAGLQREQAVTQYNLGRSLENLREWDAAQQAFDSVLKLSRELSYPRGIAYALRGQAAVQNARNEPTVALALLDQATEVQKTLPDARLRAQIQLQRGIALRLLHRLPESAAALHEALKVFSDGESLAEQAATHGALSQTLAEMGDWRGAFEQQSRFKAATDQVLTRQLDERFATLKVEYDNAARDREMALLQQSQKVTEHALVQERLAGRLLSAVIVLAGILLVVLGVLLWRHRRTSATMRGLAMTDELTGLPNRRAALTELEAQMAKAEPNCALLLADIDLFKAINDNHGHLAGDQILRAVAEAVRAIGGDVKSPAACLSRFGGEEFIAVLPKVSLDDALVAAERFRERVAALDVSRHTPGRSVTISVGVTRLAPGDTLSSLLRRADEALYAAKDGGRNCVVSRVVSRVAPEPVVNDAGDEEGEATPSVLPA
ncbi:diguanylate cyclase domain-containing protein [Piscinibacter gummiphilus]|uniref:diguanylate cyclase n=1 Tax=Piscinibacter gummiphilus TaxID=946333 RepID=A0ABZ0CTC8_9BURK|nr:diguanylate cyclase [Piscinibacter gummiphilus]WOB08230.1 diguanylate cyclase [Piscinibacter gummiphilus]